MKNKWTVDSGQWKAKPFWGAILAVFGLAVGLVWQAAAQTEEPVWETAVNLSRAGTAVQPLLVTDTNGLAYVFWQDAFSGFVITHQDGAGGWTAPAALPVPFSEPGFGSPQDEDFVIAQPALAVGGGNVLYAFWQNSDKLLLYSEVPLDNLFAREAWKFPEQVGTAAIAPTAVTDGAGRIHLAYIQTQATSNGPAGLYYRQSPNGGVLWLPPVLIQASDYLRPLELDPASARLQIAASETGQIYLTWDSPLIETVYFAHSSDGGATWQPAQAIDQRQVDDVPETPGPSHLGLALLGEEVHLSWQASHSGGACAQYHQWSSDAGATWQPATIVFSEALSCPSSAQLFNGRNNLLFLMATVRSRTTLQAWNGTAWSPAQEQEPIGKLVDPQTNQPIVLDCLQTAVNPDGRFLVIGCGSNITTQDVWALQRPLGGPEVWAPQAQPTSVWSTPIAVGVSPFEMHPVQLVGDSDGRIHALWSQSTNPVANSRIEQPELSGGSAIFYSRLDGDIWSAPRPILSLPEGVSDQPSVALTDQNTLLVVWSGGQSGEVYFSRALAERAASVSEWTAPIPLPAPRLAGGDPDILIGRDGTVNVAYAIPLNENRGIYLVQSLDNGGSWSSPLPVFDGEQAKWEMVRQPHLAETSGSLHLSWTRGTVPSGVGTLALVYAHSDDNGQTWTEPQTIAEDQIVWSDLVGVGSRSLHQVWLTLTQGRLFLWHSYSQDNGITWSPPSRITDPTSRTGPVGLVVDSAQGVQVLQLEENRANQLALQEWVWQGANWAFNSELILGEDLTQARSVTAVTLPNGRLGVAFQTLQTNPETLQLQSAMAYTNREWTVPGSTPTPLPTLTPTPTPLPTETPTPGPTPTATIAFSASSNQNSGFKLGPLNTNSQSGIILIGILPSLLIVALVFGLGFYFVQSRQK